MRFREPPSLNLQQSKRPWKTRRLLKTPRNIHMFTQSVFVVTALVQQTVFGTTEIGKTKRASSARPAQRVPWTTSPVQGSPEPPPPDRIDRVFPQFQFETPISLLSGPLGHRLFVAELGGTIYSFPRNAGDVKPEVCIAGNTEIPGLRRLYGLAFPPQFRKNRLVFLC